MKKSYVFVMLLLVLMLLLPAGCGKEPAEVPESESQSLLEEDRVESELQPETEPLIEQKPLQSVIPFQARFWRIAEIGEEAILPRVEMLNGKEATSVAAEKAVRSADWLGKLSEYRSLTLEKDGVTGTFSDMVGEAYDDAFFEEYDLLLFQVYTGGYNSCPNPLDLKLDEETGNYEMRLQIMAVEDENTTPGRWCVALAVEKSLIGNEEEAFPLILVNDGIFWVEQTDLDHFVKAGSVSYAPDVIRKGILLPFKNQNYRAKVYEILTNGDSLADEAGKTGIVNRPYAMTMITGEEDLTSLKAWGKVTLWPYLAGGLPLSSGGEVTLSLEEYAEAYDGAYFEENDLFLFQIQQNCFACRYQVSTWIQNDVTDEYKIVVTGSCREHMEASQMADGSGNYRKWLMAVELPKARTQGKMPEVEIEFLQLPSETVACYEGEGVSLSYYKEAGELDWGTPFTLKACRVDGFTGFRFYYDDYSPAVYASVGYFEEGFQRSEAVNTTFGDSRNTRLITGSDEDHKWLWMEFLHPSGCYGAYNAAEVTKADSGLSINLLSSVGLGNEPYERAFEFVSKGMQQTPKAITSKEPGDSLTITSQELLVTSGESNALPEEAILCTQKDVEALAASGVRVWPFAGPYQPNLQGCDPASVLEEYLQEHFDAAFFNQYDLYWRMEQSEGQYVAASLSPGAERGYLLQYDCYPPGGPSDVSSQTSVDRWIHLVAVEKGLLTQPPEAAVHHVSYVVEEVNDRGIRVEYPAQYLSIREWNNGDEIIRVQVPDDTDCCIEIGWWINGFKRTKAADTETVTNTHGRRVTVGYDGDGKWLWVDYNHSSGKYGTYNRNLPEKDRRILLDVALNATF